jgi:hypothetical protein
MNNLTWIKEGEKFYLKDGNETRVELALNPSGNSTILVNKRIYIAGRKGVWNPGYFATENGQEVATLKYVFWGSKGIISFMEEAAVYTCAYNSKGGLKMLFFEGEKELLRYGIGLENNRPVLSFNLTHPTEITTTILLLATFGMIAFYPLFTATTIGDDTAATVLLSTV